MIKDNAMANSCVCTDDKILRDKGLLRRMMEMMLLVRRFEEKISILFKKGIIHGTTHLCIGEEAANVGSTLALADEDYVLGTHRGHGQAMGKGADINGMMAEMLGRETGLCRGRGGSMHMCDVSKGVLCTNGIVGANAPVACGAALTSKMKGLGRVALTFLGDGSSNEGAVHESMNFAAVQSLPVIFCLIDNGFGMSTTLDRASRETDLAKRAAIYGIAALECDGNDVLQVYQTVRRARKNALAGKPTLVVEHSYRTSGHSKSDNDRYRTREEIGLWEQHNPILRFFNFLLEHSLFSQKELEDMNKSASAVIEEAVAFSLNSPLPRVKDVLDGVYA